MQWKSNPDLTRNYGPRLRVHEPGLPRWKKDVNNTIRRVNAVVFARRSRWIFHYLTCLSVVPRDVIDISSTRATRKTTTMNPSIGIRISSAKCRSTDPGQPPYRRHRLQRLAPGSAPGNSSVAQPQYLWHGDKVKPCNISVAMVTQTV